MEKIMETIKYFPDSPLPKNFQKKIQRRILIIKLRPLIYAATLILLSSSLYLSIHLYQHLVRSETITVIVAMFSDLDWSADYLLNIAAGLKEVLPFYRIGFIVINLTMLTYFLSLFKNYQYELLKI